MQLRLIPNEQLVLECIPDPEAELWGWERFAHTINGYELMGGFEPCADLTKRGTPEQSPHERGDLNHIHHLLAIAAVGEAAHQHSALDAGYSGENGFGHGNA